MASNVLNKQKCYDPQDSTLTFTEDKDHLDFLCEGFASRRARMSCGHSVTPVSLTKWCLHLMSQGETRVVCGFPGCGAVWPFQECPGCLSSVVREDESNLRTRCKSCSVRTGRTFEFCWQCLREWKGPRRRSDHCDHEDCHNPALRTLAVCPDMTFDTMRVRCPSVRACPTCGALLEHSKKNCRQIKCPQCEVSFCFICLKLSYGCSQGCTVAPRQTSLPVWKKM